MYHSCNKIDSFGLYTVRITDRIYIYVCIYYCFESGFIKFKGDCQMEKEDALNKCAVGKFHCLRGDTKLWYMIWYTRFVLAENWSFKVTKVSRYLYFWPRSMQFCLMMSGSGLSSCRWFLNLLLGLMSRWFSSHQEVMLVISACICFPFIYIFEFDCVISVFYYGERVKCCFHCLNIHGKQNNREYAALCWYIATRGYSLRSMSEKL